MKINTPIFFEKNRVARVYTGGKLFADFFHDNSEDGFEPEEWVASAVKAINKVQKSEKEGVSRIKGEDVYFDDLLREHSDELLGDSTAYRILVKFLDSAIRLPAQAHPDKAFSRKYFNSEYGKTECWIVLATRPDAKIYFGFRDGVNKEQFIEAIKESENDRDAMERLMIARPAKAGDVYLVPAKTVHAIGKGCLILEIQEPTDFTVQPERFCGDYRLSDKEMYLTLTPEEAIECFDFEGSADPKVTPETIEKGDGVLVESYIGPKNTDCFVINKITLKGGEKCLNVEKSYGLYIITSGDGLLLGENYSRRIGKGDYFFLPASLMGKFKVKGELELFECY